MQDSEYKHNFHTHTFRCKHAQGDAVDYCEMALKLGMATLGFSDHTPLPDDRWIQARMNYTQLDDYVEAVFRAQLEYPDLRVLLGMECEYVPKFHAFYEDELFGERHFDYLVGGPHFFTDDYGEWQGTYNGTVDRKSLLDYARYVCEMIESGLFDFIAHPDLFGNCYADWDQHTEAASKAILQTAYECDVGLEINALGCRKIAKKKASNPYPMYPWLPFWELASDYDVKVIVNSDAHRPKDLQALTSEAEAIRERCNLEAMNPDMIGRRAAN
ncbi:MAG: histidinol-phosphatase [Gammaproteobacteria bacterium]|nr:histidinol-phosphatase [Gammaproteobacteria bacterium]